MNRGVASPTKDTSVKLKGRKSLKVPLALTENHPSSNQRNERSPLSHNYLKNKLSLKKWMDTDYDVVSTMKEEIQALRELFGQRISQEMLLQIEDRYVVFLEDGADIQKILDTHDDYKATVDGKKQYPKKVTVNINRYIAKYNFEIARKLKGAQMDLTKPTEN